MKTLHTNQIKNKIKKCVAWFQLLFFTILGLAPISLRKVSKTHTDIFEFSVLRINSSYNLAFAVFIFGLNTTQICAIEEEHLIDQSNFTKVIIFCTNFIMALVQMFLLVFYFVNRTTVKKIANRVLHFDLIASKMIEISKPNVITYKSCFPFFIQIILLTIHIILTICVLGLSFYFSAILLATITITSFIIEYSMILNSLLCRFENFNKAFMNITSISKYSSISLASNSILSSKIKVCKSDEVLLARYMEIHEILYDITYDVAELYSLPSLLVISCITCMIIFNAYWFTMPFATLTSRNLQVIEHILSLSWLLVEIFPILSLTTTVSSVNGQMQATKDILHKFSDHFAIDGAQKSKMEIYALALHYRRVAFSGYHVFDLDKTLIDKVFVAAVTYVTIIIQNQKSTV